MTYKKTNGKTKEIYHNFQFGKTTLIVSTWQLWSFVSKIIIIITFLIGVSTFTIVYIIPIYINVNKIPAIQTKLDSNRVVMDTIKVRQISFQLITELRHQREDSLKDKKGK